MIALKLICNTFAVFFKSQTAEEIYTLCIEDSDNDSSFQVNGYDVTRETKKIIIEIQCTNRNPDAPCQT